jgi:two-component system sensor histidine kinase RegB
LTTPDPDVAWLVRLRTVSVAGILVLVLLARFGFDQPLSLLRVGGVLALWLATNMAVVPAARRGWATEPTVAGLLALDAVLFTVVLYLTGGPSNPFSFLYLVHVALGAVVLPRRYAWGLVALTAALSAMLFLDHVPLEHEHHHDASAMALHVRGMWLASAVGAGMIVAFTHRIRSTLAARERELTEAREHAARSDRLAALATLAAGAAHELGTPLSTIALAAKELALTLGDGPGADDAVLIREEVVRCRRILDQLAVAAGEPAGEAPALVAPGELVDRALGELEARDRVRVEVAEGAEGRRLRVGPTVVAQALRSLVRNALDASPAGAPVVVRCAPERGGIAISVHDRGAGMDARTLARVGEPFFSTKPTGRGMGLGVYLARSVAERLGGRLELASRPGDGTTATLHLPEASR